MSQKENFSAEEKDFTGLRSMDRALRHAHMRILSAEAVADSGFLADMREVVVDYELVLADQWPVEDKEASRT